MDVYGWNHPALTSAFVLNGASYTDKTYFINVIPDSKVHWANMGPTWVLSAPDGPHVGPMNPMMD